VKSELLHIVAYDIADNRRRLRAADSLLNIGARMGLSLFELRIEPKLASQTVREVSSILDTNTDRIHLYRICANCERFNEFHGLKWGR